MPGNFQFSRIFIPAGEIGYLILLVSSLLEHTLQKGILLLAGVVGKKVIFSPFVHFAKDAPRFYAHLIGGNVLRAEGYHFVYVVFPLLLLQGAVSENEIKADI